MTTRKDELIAVLKESKPDRKACSVRVEKGIFDKIEKISAETGKSYNDIINILLEISLVEYEK